MKPLRFFLCAFLALGVAGCDLFGGDNDDGPTPATGVIVGNSGNFADQDGSVTVFDPATGTASPVDLEVAFVNSLALNRGLLYVVDNTISDGGGRITMFNENNLAAAGQISFTQPPRAIAFADNNKAYVTLYGPFDENFNPTPGSVAVVNLNTNTITKTLDAGRQPEGLAVADGKVFVANVGSGGRSTTMTVIDTATDEVTNTIDLGCEGPDELFVDDNDEVIVVCGGQASWTGTATNGQVLFLNPDAETITTRVTLPNGVGSVNGTQMGYYADETLLVLSSGTDEIFRFDTRTNTLAETIAVPPAADLVGLAALAYDAGRGDLYVARMPVGDGGGPDFTAAGAVVVLDDAGQQTGRFTVGISPAHIVLQ